MMDHPDHKCDEHRKTREPDETPAPDGLWRVSGASSGTRLAIERGLFDKVGSHAGAGRLDREW